MCLILLAYHVHPKYKVVLAANRDEFYIRPTQHAHFWTDHPNVLAGKDLKAGGTWLGISKHGRLAAITNYREGKNESTDAPSRGGLVSDYLISNMSAESYLRNLRSTGSEYNGFSLLFGDANALFYFSNRAGGFETVAPGIHGLSNHTLDTPWPKIKTGKKRFAEILAEEKIHEERVFELLGDKETADDASLPDTGVGLELERILSPIFISSSGYGTRSSTIVLIDKHDAVTFAERSFKNGQVKTVRHEFKIQK